MKTWTVKTVVSPDHKVAFKVPEDIPEGPVEIVVVVQPVAEGIPLVDNVKDLPMQNQDQKPKILDQGRSMMRLHHYSIHTERTYIVWIKRYIAFAGMIV